MINVLLVDDHELVRSGIKQLLDDTGGIRVINEAGSGEEAIELVRKKKPDVILMDISMPGIGGLEATRRLIKISPDVKIIGLSMHVDEPYPTRMLEAGAVGYLSKSCAADEIINAIHAVHEGERYLGADIARQVALSMLPGGKLAPFEKLSQREMQVLLMVSQGHGIQDISDRLCLSPKTVSTYRYRLHHKLGVDNDVELTHLAIRHGVIELGVSE